MKRQGRTGAALAEHLGLSRSSLYRRLGGYVPWNMEELYLTSLWLDVSVVPFFEWDAA